MYTEDNIGYVSGRLQETVFRLKNGRPVYCQYVSKENDKIFIHYRNLENFSTSSLKVGRLNLFDFSSPPLGNMNHDGKAYYCTRLPLRNDWRQGIRSNNLLVNQGGRTNSRFRFHCISILTIPILGIYPSYKDALNRTEDIHKSCAFSRFFSVDHKQIIWYKEHLKVGKHSDSDGALINEEFFWLDDLLKEELKKNA